MSTSLIFLDQDSEENFADIMVFFAMFWGIRNMVRVKYIRESVDIN